MAKLLAPALQPVARLARPRLTVIRSGGLGDTILLLPALQWLRARLPGARLTLVGSAWAAALRPLVPWPLAVVPFDAPALARLFGDDTAQAGTLLPAADAVILYTADPRSAFVQNVVRASACPVIVRPVVPPGGRHAAVHFLEAVAGAALAVGEFDAPALSVADDLRAWGQAWLEARLGRGVEPVAVHPGSGGRRKCWPPGRFAELVARLGAPALLIEGAADAEATCAVRAALPARLPLAVARGLRVAELAAVLRGSPRFVGNDSGVTHLAAALGLPTLAIFGPTDPGTWAPLGARAAVVSPDRGAGWPPVEDVLRGMAALAPAPLPGDVGQ